MMQPIEEALGAGHTYVYATAPYAAGLWIRDPPGGKGEPTTDPNFASESFAVIDNHVTNDGPFDALMGYSQGAAMVLLYLSEYASRFQFALTFCGYLPSTHTGLNNRIAAAAPMSIPILFYMGTADAVIDNALTREAAAQFSNPTLVVDGGGHAPPQSGAAVDEIVAFINGGYTTPANEPSSGPPPPPAAASPPPAAQSPPPPDNKSGGGGGSSGGAKSDATDEDAGNVTLYVALSLGGVALLVLGCLLRRWCCVRDDMSVAPRLSVSFGRSKGSWV